MRWNCKGNFFTESSSKISWQWDVLGCGIVSQGARLTPCHLSHLVLATTKHSQEGDYLVLLYHQHLYFCNVWLWINCKGGSVGRGETNIIFNTKEHRNTMGKCFVCFFWKCSYLQVWLSKSFFTCTCRSVIESCDKTLVSDTQRRKSSDCKIKTRKKDKEGKYVSQDKNSSLLIQTANSND